MFVFAIRISEHSSMSAVLQVDEMKHAACRGSRKSVPRTVHEKLDLRNLHEKSEAGGWFGHQIQ